jgi:hypothetical protein
MSLWARSLSSGAFQERLAPRRSRRYWLGARSLSEKLLEVSAQMVETARPAPDCRPRRTLLHLSYSSAPLYADGAFVTDDPKAELLHTAGCAGRRPKRLNYLKQPAGPAGVTGQCRWRWLQQYPPPAYPNPGQSPGYPGGERELLTKRCWRCLVATAICSPHQAWPTEVCS